MDHTDPKMQALYDRRQAEHDAAQKRKRREAKDSRDEAHAEHLERLETQRQVQSARDEAETDAALEPTKKRKQREFLLAYPDKSKADFERFWKTRQRAAVLEELRDAALQKNLEQLREGGAYTG